MTPRERRSVEVSNVLGNRRLYWFGIRGSDANTLLGLPQFAGSFSVTAPIQSPGLEVDIALESLTGQRVDLDTYDIDLDEIELASISEIRRRMLATFAYPSAIATYRPSDFLSSVALASLEHCLYLGMFKDRQAAFEYKPWVELGIGEEGIPTIPWTYVPIEARASLGARIAEWPLVLRPNRTSGGVGIEMVANTAELLDKWFDDQSHVIGVSEFLTDAMPINVGGCVFPTGSVSLHPGSVQLIGIPEATNRRFGFCGNDFAAFATIDRETVKEIDRQTRVVGAWLHRHGYLGAFGVDFLLQDGIPIFTEVNARFQGSTALGATLAASVSHSDILMDHLAANLRLDRGTNLTLEDWLRELDPVADLVVHNKEAVPVNSIRPTHRRATRVELVPPDTVRVDPGGVLGRLVFNEQITSSGYELEVPLGAQLCLIEPGAEQLQHDSP